MIDNSLAKLLNDIEPKIRNIEEARIELGALKDVSHTMEELIELGKESYSELINFYDQDFLFKTIKIGNSNANNLIEKYKTSKYLLKNRDPSFQELPQFKDAIIFMESLYKYLYGLYEKIKLEYETKDDNLKIQELLNKYYGLLNRDDIFITNIDEFLEFLDLNSISIEDRFNIYKFINKSNIKKYIKTNDIELKDNVSLSDINKFIKDNEDLLKENVLEYKSLKELLKEKEKIDVQDFDKRKIYLIHKIKKLLIEHKYIEIIDYYLEFNKLDDYKLEFVKQNVRPRKLLFIPHQGVSLVREYLEHTTSEYKNCVLKNLLDIEQEYGFVEPVMKYDNRYLYINNDFVVKTVYTFLENGNVLILGVIDYKETLETFLEKHENLIKEELKKIELIELNQDERDLILKNIKLEDLVLAMDLDTLDINMEDKNAR